MYKTNIKKNVVVYALIVLLCLTTLLTYQVKTAAAAVPIGTQAAVADTNTMYYLKVPTQNITIQTRNENLMATIVPWLSPRWNVFEDAALLTTNRTHTFILTYNNIKVNDSPLLTTWNIETTCVGWSNFWGGYLNFYPKNDIEINIRSEYYELFQNADFTHVTITYMYQGNGFLMTDGTQSYYDFSGAQLFTREVPPEYDPITEEGQAPDNGGIAVDPATPAPPSWWDNWWKSFPDIFGNLDSVILLIVVVVGAVIAIRYIKPKSKRK